MILRRILLVLGLVLWPALAGAAGGLLYPGGLKALDPAGCVRWDPAVNPATFRSTGVACGTADTSAGVNCAALAAITTPGSIRYCTDCLATSPCTCGGTGAFAQRTGSAWNCSSAGGGGTECASSPCNLNTATTLNTKAICLADGTNCPAGAAPSFSALTNGTNTAAAMVVGSGASLTFTGSGTITASNVTCSSCIDVTSEVSGLLPVANGGTGAANLNAFCLANTTNCPIAAVGQTGLINTSAQTVQGLKTFNSGLTTYDNTTSIADGADTTKIAQFKADAITTGTTRTFDFPNASGTLCLQGQYCAPFGTPGPALTPGFPFSAIGSGTNTTAAMVVSAGASLDASTGQVQIPRNNDCSGVIGSPGMICWDDNDHALVMYGTSWHQVVSPDGSPATGDVAYANGAATSANQWSRLADVASGNVLLSGGVSTAPAYGKVGLTTHVSGTLPIANGGTGSTTSGADKQIIFNDGGTVLAGNAALTFDKTSRIATVAGSSLIATTDPMMLFKPQVQRSVRDNALVEWQTNAGVSWLRMQDNKILHGKFGNNGDSYQTTSDTDPDWYIHFTLGNPTNPHNLNPGQGQFFVLDQDIKITTDDANFGVYGGHIYQRINSANTKRTGFMSGWSANQYFEGTGSLSVYERGFSANEFIRHTGNGNVLPHAGGYGVAIYLGPNSGTTASTSVVEGYLMDSGGLESGCTGGKSGQTCNHVSELTAYNMSSGFDNYADKIYLIKSSQAGAQSTLPGKTRIGAVGDPSGSYFIDLVGGDVFLGDSAGTNGVELASSVLKKKGTGSIQADAVVCSGSCIGDAEVDDTITLSNITQITTRPHNSLTGLTSGDDHTQYAKLGGRSGGQTLYGGTGAGELLALHGSSGGDGFVTMSGTNTSFSFDESLGLLSLSNISTNVSGLYEGFGNTTTVSPNFVFHRGRGTAAAPTALTNNSIIGQFLFMGSMNTTPGNFVQAAEIDIAATETWSASQNGTRMLFKGTPNGSLVQAEWMRLANGKVGFGDFVTEVNPTNDVGLDGTAARVIGSERHTTSNTAGNNLTVTAGGAKAAATDKAGGDLLLTPGVGTGTAREMVRVEGYVPATATGTADQTQVDRKFIGAFKALTNNTAVTVANVTVASNTVAAGNLKYAVEVFNGTDLQVEEGVVSYHVTNKAGTIANNTTVKAVNQQAATSGTLTVTWAISAADPALLSVNANSSLTPSTGYPRVTYTLDNLTQQAVAIQ